MIVHDPRNPKAVAIAAAVKELAPGIHAREDLTVVVGGDGFLLHTVHEHGFKQQYLGLNAGTLGFLLNDAEDLERVVQAIVDDQWSEHRFPLLEAKVTLGTGEQITGYAMNDVYLERSTGQTARISLAIDGHHVVDQLSADGLILATALGSTAYSFSAGGTPCVPSLPVMCVTPICPHKPRLSPFVLPYGARAAIEVFAPERRPVRVVIDGADHEDVRSVAVGPTEHQVRMGYLSGHDFTGQMVGKLLT